MKRYLTFLLRKNKKRKRNIFVKQDLNLIPKWKARTIHILESVLELRIIIHKIYLHFLKKKRKEKKGTL